MSLVAGLVVVATAAVVSISYANYFNLVSIVLFTLPLVVIVAYDINCVIVGQCATWGWIKTILVVIAFASAFYAQAWSVREREHTRVAAPRPSSRPFYSRPSRAPSWAPDDLNDSTARRNREDTEDRTGVDASGNRLKDASGNWVDAAGRIIHRAH